MVDVSQLGHIGVLYGGYSSEREISLKSGSAIIKALTESGCRVTPIDVNTKVKEEIADLIKRSGIDVAFIALHGAGGEDGVVQEILEKLKIPYTGSGVKASQNALDKVLAQEIFVKNKIPAALSKAVSKKGKNNVEDLLKFFNGSPLVVKPSCEGSSIGISFVKDKKDLPKALESAFVFGPEVIVQRFIQGRELTVGILDDQALPIVEIKYNSEFFDFSTKYLKGGNEYLVPAPLPQNIAQKVQTLALKAHQVLGCKDYSRVDVMLDEKMNPYVLEVNTIPGFTASSLLPKAAAKAGIDFNSLCLRLVKLAYGKNNKKK
ncbi:MAG: hypothetical protein A2Z88_11250 [Omnitrophica WOR_2 bacterium GWA2_47_8]|nr:MAG: hypothetical protein A2Z88_11250 [Omnitrophica WOR_2 bacterium GWA2_47_8]